MTESMFQSSKTLPSTNSRAIMTLVLGFVRYLSLLLSLFFWDSLAMLPRLFSNSWVQVTLLPQPPEQLIL
jgi:hypothetical protein